MLVEDPAPKWIELFVVVVAAATAARSLAGWLASGQLERANDNNSCLAACLPLWPPLAARLADAVPLIIIRPLACRLYVN